MNHSFFPSQLNPAQCKSCKLSLLQHLATAECQACSNKDPKEDNKGNHLEMHMTILMCRECKAKEDALQAESQKPENQEKRVIESNSRTQEAINQHIESYVGFFNARITPIVQVKELYDIQGKTLAEFHESIKNQIEQFTRVLFEQQITTTEDTISKLLIEFRAEIRTKLKEGDINYTPPVRAPKVSTSKVAGKAKTPLEKMAELVVAQAASNGKIMTIAEATRKLQREMGLTK